MISTEPSAEAALRKASPERPASEGGNAARVVAALVVSATVFWAYFSEFQWLWKAWAGDPNYSHGFLVIPVALLIYWRRNPDPNHRDHPWQWGWLALTVILAAHFVLHERGNRWASTVTLLPALGCLAVTLGGERELRRAWPAIAYLIFMAPLPSAINDVVAQPLQTIATTASVAVLRLTGLWVISTGNVIFLGKHPLAVAEACNGLSMMMSLGATAVAAVLLVPISLWMRAVVLATVLPIALISNIIRIVATGWAIHSLGPEKGATVAHDAAGWLMMPLALAMVALELALLTWLFVEEEQVVEPMLLGRPIVGREARPPELGNDRPPPSAGPRLGGPTG